MLNHRESERFSREAPNGTSFWSSRLGSTDVASKARRRVRTYLMERPFRLTLYTGSISWHPSFGTCNSMFYPLLQAYKMCILFLHFCDNPDPDGYRMIAASNREEFYGKRTAPADFHWKEKIVGGKYSWLLHKSARCVLILLHNSFTTSFTFDPIKKTAINLSGGITVWVVTVVIVHAIISCSPWNYGQTSLLLR